jgi:putative ABC transport system permease protein
VTLVQDIRYAFRHLLRSPGGSLILITMLALGIGGTTGIYSIYDTVLLKPLPVPDPENLVNLSVPGPRFGMASSGQSGRNQYIFSYPMLRDLQAGQDVFTGIAGHRLFDASLAFDGQTAAAEGFVVSGSYFDVLGLEPALGTLIGQQHEAGIGESPVAVLGFDFWQTAFGGSRDVIGRTLRVNGQALTVIGVAPQSFTGTTIGVRPAVFAPLSMQQALMPAFGMGGDDREAYWVYAFARLRDGVSSATAEASLNVLFRGITAEVEAPLHADLPPDLLQTFLAQRIVLEPGAQGQSNAQLYVTRPLTFLLGITGLLLAIVCVNVGGLLLVRGDARLNESAVRMSVGAERGRLLRLFMSEAALLAVIGGMASLPVATVTVRAFAAMLPAQQAGSVVFGIERPAYVLTALLVGATLALSALYPALRASRVNPSALINAYGQKSTGSPGFSRFRSGLAMGQIALSMALLVLCGLFVRSLYNLTSLDLGMDTDSVVAFSVSPRLSGYDDPRAIRIIDGIEDALASEPGITGAASSMVPLLTGSNWQRNVALEGIESGPGIDTESRFNRVGPAFFRTMAMRRLAGREFTADDTAAAPPVAIVNEAFLRKFELGADVIGRRLGMNAMDPELDIEIVGVVADAKYSEVKDPAPPQIFLPRRQSTGYGTMTYYVRGNIGPDAIMRQVRSVVSRIDPDLPVNGLTTVRQLANDNVFLDRSVTLLTAAFALTATLLAGIGLYGTLAYNVARRTRELGIRMALGASPAGLRFRVLAQVGRVTLIGASAGLVLAILIGYRAESLLFGLTAIDPLVFAVALALIAAVALAAGALPARRASGTAPIEALRHE